MIREYFADFLFYNVVFVVLREFSPIFGRFLVQFTILEISYLQLRFIRRVFEFTGCHLVSLCCLHNFGAVILGGSNFGCFALFRLFWLSWSFLSVELGWYAFSIVPIFQFYCFQRWIVWTATGKKRVRHSVRSRDVRSMLTRWCTSTAMWAL